MTHTLKQWETYLSKQMPRVRLLSELGLNYEDMMEIAALIKAEHTKRPNIQRTTVYLIDNFPCTFVAFLAAFAAQNTEREFWDALARLLNVSGGELNNAKWRTHFIEILKSRKIPTFENVGHMYVGNMRVHGGIPSYSLRDFFANMLMPSIEKAEYIELRGQELLDALLERSVVQLFTDSTVRNFFENSSEIGLEFLESSRYVARTYRSKRQVPSDHKLPNYVVQKLVGFLENREDEITGLRRPKIRFDAEGDGLLLDLPEEPLGGANVLGNQAVWQIYRNKELLQEIRARITRSGRDVHTERIESISLGYLLDPFRVTFSVLGTNGQYNTLREWSFEVRSTETANLLVFRSEDGSLLRWSQALPAQDLILVYPKSISLEFEGDARLIHTPEIYADGWYHWQAEHRSLENAFSLSLVKDGNTELIIPIQKQIELPLLTGRLFSPNLDSKPLYLHNPPTLRIPLRPGTILQNELKRWHVEITSAWEAEPSCRTDFKLHEKSEYIHQEENFIDFDLTEVLGNEPKGTYTLHIRGPLETDVELPFRVWPLLYIKDLPEFILPSIEENPVLHFTLPSRASLETQAGVTGVNITGRYGQYAVELGETTPQLDLNLVWSPEASSVHVPISLPIPYIRWRVILNDEKKDEWSTRATRQPVESFLQSGQISTLLIHLPGIEKRAKQVFVRLIDPENVGTTLQEFPVHSSVLGNDHLRFLLAAKDTIRDRADVSVFEFQLMIPDAAGIYESITLLTLTRDLDVSHIRIEESEDSLFLFWKELAPLRNRRIFIRSMWKVWADAWNIKIPDDARGKFDLLAAGFGLPPSWYEVHFYVAPSWQDDISAPPDHSTFIVKTVSPADQLSWLENNFQKHSERAFLAHFERACIYSTIGDEVQREHEIQLCYNHIDQAKPKELFAFHEWLKKLESVTMRAVRMKMYNPEHLEQLYANFKSGDEFRQQYQQYVLETHFKPESALLLIENENEPAIVFYALRELVKRQDDRLLSVIALMLEDGRLSDADAIDLLKAEKEHFLSILNSAEPTDANLRMLSGLLRGNTELLATLSNERVLDLAKAEKRPEALKLYLELLIERKDRHGVDYVMDLFQQGRLLGEEVTLLLGKSPRFSSQILSVSEQSHAYAIQIAELKRRFPADLDRIVPGLYVKTPIGWAKIQSIEDQNGEPLPYSSVPEGTARLHLTFVNIYPPVQGVLDVQSKRLHFESSVILFQCGKCNYVSPHQNFILRDHTRQYHDGIGPSVRRVPSVITISTELKFSKEISK